MSIFISTVPFAENFSSPKHLLQSIGVPIRVNPLNRKMTETELMESLGDSQALVAGTEPISARVMDSAPKLGIIARVGIGLDNVDLLAAKERNIKVTYTPDAPSPAVADLTLGLMMSLTRHLHLSNISMHEGIWKRYTGRRLRECSIGVVGIGRIGSLVVEDLVNLGVRQVMVNDINHETYKVLPHGVVPVSLSTLLQASDITSVHVPLTSLTSGMFGAATFSIMKPGSALVNTSRGEVVDERALANALDSKHLSGAALDVFEREPYTGELTRRKDVLLTSHMGSMSVDCRHQMEIEACQSVVAFFRGAPLLQAVPESEYQARIAR